MRGRIPEDEHPLHKAIRLKDKAKKSKANPKLIANLELRVREEASKSLKLMGGMEGIERMVNSVNNRSKYKHRKSLIKKTNKEIKELRSK